MNKTIIAPIVGVLVIITKLVFGVDVPEDVQAQIVDVLSSAIAIILVVVGIFQNHQKKTSMQKDEVK